MSQTNSTHTTETTAQNTTGSTEAKTSTAHTSANDENRWAARLEELLNVKNIDDLKSELGKLASEIQTEIQKFDINAHLSPEAKTRLKALEGRYAKVMKAIHKAQKQFDREFNKSLRVLKRTRQDAEKQFENIRTRITKHRSTIVKASSDLTKKIKKSAGKASGTTKAGATKSARKVARKAKGKA
jgi:hypothetical protein